ncbi:MAG: hypothetical protein JWO13_1591 [Acidobacteriales bacterium]|nr:hypothetical protein [Terriglobales bacterium]
MLRDDGERVFGDVGAEADSDVADDAESQHPSGDDGENERYNFHLEDAGRKNQQLEWSGRRQHCRNHDEEKFLLLEFVTKFFEPSVADAFQEEGFAAAASDPVWEQAADG